MAKLVRGALFCFAILVVAGSAAMASGQQTGNRIVGPIDELRLVTLKGNVHPRALREYDLGSVEANMRMDRMVLELMPYAPQQNELDALVEAQQDIGSPLFHAWITPNEFGARFGASLAEVAVVSAWLRERGFTVDEVAASNRLIVFSGTAGDVETAFHTEIHRYRVDGVEHIANSQDQQIPAALAGVVGGVVSLHDFRRRREIAARKEMEAAPVYSSGNTHYLFPADWATIYDLNPLYAVGMSGAGISIAVAGRSNINVSDVAAFRAGAGLGVNNPTVIVPGTNPGLVSGDQDESTLDVEWSGAIAPEASVKFVVEASTAATDGVDLAATYIVNHALAPVVSVSYGSCEQYMGTTELTFYHSLWEQAAAQGMSVFVASGDAGAAGCNTGPETTGEGTAVNGLCSSPYSTCVGGTEFNEGTVPGEYWGTANSAGNGSALGYIPEEVWNESAADGGSGLWSSGGGASTVYAAPAWQTGLSGTGTAGEAGGMRTVPDVAVSAADHDGYAIYENGVYWIIAGTSASSPSFAGLMALVVEKQGGTGLGSANAELYALANGARSPFHATPSGNNSVPGVTGFAANGGRYNLATGLGSVDGSVMADEWGGGLGRVMPEPVRGPVRVRCRGCLEK